jgi:hypothetical protein
MSKHLDDIIAKQYGATNVMVVFLDIIKYSLRKSVMQQKVISGFNTILQKALDDVSKTYAPDAQRQNLNFLNDIIKIPTGDGAAIVFPFQGLQNIHLHFAITFLDASDRNNDECQLFAEHGWCNCHDFFDVRIGISDGRAIIFKDINGNYNVAGNPVNVAARVMGFGDRKQVLLTDEAYKNVIDMTLDTDLESKFKAHGKIRVKHNVVIPIYQYVGAGDNFINTETPIQVELQNHINSIQQNPIFQNITAEPSDPNQMLLILEQMTQTMSLMGNDATADLSKFLGLMTSAEGMNRFREYIEASGKLTDLQKKMFKE